MPGESLQGHSAGTVSPPPSPCRPVAECQTRGHGQHPTQGPALCLTARRPWAGLTPQPADAPPVRWEQPSTSPVSAVGSHESCLEHRAGWSAFWGRVPAPAPPSSVTPGEAARLSAGFLFHRWGCACCCHIGGEEQISNSNICKCLGLKAANNG